MTLTGMVQDQDLEKQIGKQMGCMAGFFQIFDRPQVLTGKQRLYSSDTKRLPPSPTVAADSTPDSGPGSPAVSRELEKQQRLRTGAAPSPDRLKQSPVVVPELRSPSPEPATPTKSPLPLPIFELKEGTNKCAWRFGKEAPRLSLDSRATFDAKGSLKPREIRTNAAILSANRCCIANGNGGDETDDGSDKQRRSPSVIARLMGLELLPNSDPPSQQQAKTPELRRSASESRASRDLFQYRFIDGINFQLKQPQSNVTTNAVGDGCGGKDQRTNSFRAMAADPKECINAVRNIRGPPTRPQQRAGGVLQRKSFFDSADFFPEPKQTVSIYGEIEKRLKMRGIDEPAKDLETLKQILEALQLKGLLHSSKPVSTSQLRNRNFVYERSFKHDESPIVVMKPATAGLRRTGLVGSDPPPPSFRGRAGLRREQNVSGQTALSPSRHRPDVERNVRGQSRGRNSSSPTRSESSVKSPSRRRPLSVETQRRGNESMAVEQRRGSPVQSPRIGSRRTGPDQSSNRSPRNRKPAAVEKVFVPAEDETSSTTVSESSISTDTDRSKVEEYKDGRNLLERCDKLLHSIAEMAAAAAAAATEMQQPSPVSVLNSSFYKEESIPSPVMKRSVDFKDQLADLEADVWGPAAISPFHSKLEGSSDDCDFLYISDVLRESNYLPNESDVFLSLEEQQYRKGKDTSKVSRLQRKLIFDTITEILNRKRQLPPWKAICWTNSTNGQASLRQVWSEFQKIRERDASDDLLEVICGALKKDLAVDAINGWGDCPIEMSEAVLYIERHIFRDLIGETIRDLAAFAGQCNQVAVPRRKLVF